ncbi:hypothetical protein [Ekhidna sp.]|jgi:hypothetical protein|uniref:hypothetical protein n=1 Tax=Ekhidna sp. TaxID=2608089 RepID=UPI0032EF1335
MKVDWVSLGIGSFLGLILPWLFMTIYSYFHHKKYEGKYVAIYKNKQHARYIFRLTYKILLSRFDLKGLSIDRIDDTYRIKDGILEGRVSFSLNDPSKGNGYYRHLEFYENNSQDHMFGFLNLQKARNKDLLVIHTYSVDPSKGKGVGKDADYVSREPSYVWLNKEGVNFDIFPGLKNIIQDSL